MPDDRVETGKGSRQVPSDKSIFEKLEVEIGKVLKQMPCGEMINLA